jgi:hypothetical protein
VSLPIHYAFPTYIFGSFKKREDHCAAHRRAEIIKPKNKIIIYRFSDKCNHDLLHERQEGTEC